MKKLYVVYVKSIKGHPILRAAIFTTRKKAEEFILSLKTGEDLLMYRNERMSVAWIEVELGVVDLDS